MLVVVGIGWMLYYYPIGAPLGRLSYDLPFDFRNRLPTPEMRLVIIDEKSARALNQPIDAPWDRRLHAQLVKSLTDLGARAILFDIVFNEPSADPGADDALIQAIRDSGRVFLGAGVVSLPGRDADEEKLLPPILPLRRAAVDWGLLVVRPVDPDLGVRRIYTGSDVRTSITWKMARRLGAPLPETPDTDERWLHYYGPAGLMKSVGYNVALGSPDLAPDFFKDKIVIVGGQQSINNFDQQKDQFSTPYTLWGQPYAAGMEIHAVTLLNLLHHDWLERPSVGVEGTLVILYGIFISLLLSLVCKYGPFQAVAVAVVCAALNAGIASWSAWHFHIWFDWLVPSAIQTPVALFWAVGTNYLLQVRRRAAIRRAFSLYLSPHMADEIAESRFDLKPGGKLTEASVIFTDLKGFTSLSEKINDPSLIADVMIAYFNNTTKHVLENRGTIIKYMGDAVFASWGAPLADEDHAYHAALAAWGMHLAGQEEVRGYRLVTRIGVNTGTMLSGNLGSDFRFDYTLFGDPVNVASRLEGLNKYLGTHVLVAEATWVKLRGRFAGRDVGKFVFVGKATPITIYELLGPSVTDEIKERVECFGHALAQFQAGDLAAARAAFENLLAQYHSDGPSEFYLGEIARLEQQKLPSEWNGAIVLDAK